MTIANHIPAVQSPNRQKRFLAIQSHVKKVSNFQSIEYLAFLSASEDFLLFNQSYEKTLFILIWPMLSLRSRLKTIRLLVYDVKPCSVTSRVFQVKSWARRTVQDLLADYGINDVFSLQRRSSQRWVGCEK